MKLAASLRVEPGQVLAFTGAGGKTQAITRLAQELSQGPVLVTTTTRLGHDQGGFAALHLQVTEPDWQAALQENLSPGRPLLLTGAPDPEGKWTSPGVEALAAARGLVVAAGGVMLVEADGARSRSLKAPASHEPVVPDFADQVAVLAGLDALGRPLSPEVVHRPELAGPIMGIEPGEAIGAEHVARLLGSAAGGLQGIPETALVRAVLNKAAPPDRTSAGRSLAGALLDGPRFRSVLLCEVAAQDPVLEVFSRVGAVVLAAGGSTRFGRQKLLETWQGAPLVRYAARAGLEAGLLTVVVTGAEGDRTRVALAGLPVEHVNNPDWASGQSGSLRAGLAALAGRVDAVVFLLGDMPLVDSALVEALVAEHRLTLAPVVAAGRDGRPANPVLFDRVTFGALDAIRGDQGGRAIFEQHPPQLVDWGRAAAIDVDRLEDLRGLSKGDK